jgi:hypothetical protein
MCANSYVLLANSARDNHPAETVTIRGDFANRRRAEILYLVRRQKQQKKFEIPVVGSWGSKKKSDSMVFKTTDINPPRSIGSALRNT